MRYNYNDIISINDYERKDLEYFLQIIHKFDTQEYPTLLYNLIIGSIFLEASTRTHLSFISAAKRLGASTIRFPSTLSSFQHKKETFYDTLRVVESYIDLLILRHPLEGSARLAADTLTIPVINAGDGSNQHPTQTFIDLYTIQKHLHTLDSLSIAFVGDLRFGRTVHSLVDALKHFDCSIHFISPKNLTIPPLYKQKLSQYNRSFFEHDTLPDVLPKVDIIYMTRFQRERFIDDEEFDFIEHNYAIDKELLTRLAKDTLKVLHPLPRGNEIHRNIDNSPYALYFEQAKNGIPVRKALLSIVLNKLNGV